MNSAKASQQRTMEEKVKRLQELIKRDHIQYMDWLKQAEDLGENFLSHYCKYTDTSRYYKIVLATWDVHTGIAFSPLYRML